MLNQVNVDLKVKNYLACPMDYVQVVAIRPSAVISKWSSLTGSTARVWECKERRRRILWQRLGRTRPVRRGITSGGWYDSQSHRPSSLALGQGRWSRKRSKWNKCPYTHACPSADECSQWWLLPRNDHTQLQADERCFQEKQTLEMPLAADSFITMSAYLAVQHSTSKKVQISQRFGPRFHSCVT